MTEKERLRREEKAKKVDKKIDTLWREYTTKSKKYADELDYLDNEIMRLKKIYTSLVSY